MFQLLNISLSVRESLHAILQVNTKYIQQMLVENLYILVSIKAVVLLETIYFLCDKNPNLNVILLHLYTLCMKCLNLHICKCQTDRNVELKCYKNNVQSLYFLGCDWYENDTNTASFALNLSYDWSKKHWVPLVTRSLHCKTYM